MKIESIENQFARMGARFKVTYPVISPAGYAIDIRSDRHGQFFEMRIPDPSSSSLEMAVLQAKPQERHILLLVKQQQEKDRFLCGHDEREWFVAAVPGGASSVAQAKVALKPAAVLAAEHRAGLTRAQRNSRHNRAYIRQGEWFFVPVEKLVVDPRMILRDEPIRRGGGKPHLVEEVFRSGGEFVWVCSQHPNGVIDAVHKQILRRNPNAKRWDWRRTVRAARVYARGAVRHRDHRTITLHSWHEVWMNTETQSRTMRNLAFID